MEMKRSKREGRQSQLDLFSIYEKKENMKKNVVGNLDKNKKWKNKGFIKRTFKQRKAKKVKKKKDVIKISKSLRKK